MINIFCALHCEAQAIIQNFKLTELKQFHLFRLFQSRDKEISLSITGIGKLNAASAVSYHHASVHTKASDIWLNVGIAGHKNIEIGEVRLVNKITDEQTKENWYPQIIFKPPCDSHALITVDKPSNDYQESLFDMEASGFYQMAIRLGTVELIHSLKIISDNTDQPTSTVNADGVKTMMAKHSKTIESLLSSLQPLSDELSSVISSPDKYNHFVERWHFTQSERIQLSRLLQQWCLRLPDEDVEKYVKEHASGKSVLHSLREKISTSEFMIHD